MDRIDTKRSLLKAVGALMLVAVLALSASHLRVRQEPQSRPLPAFSAVLTSGTEHRYEMTFESGGSMNFGTSGGKSQSIGMKLKGEWVVQAINSEHTVALHFEKLSLQGQSTLGIDFRAAQEELGRNFYLKISDTGKPEGVSFEGHTGEFAQGVVKTLVTLMQFQIPEDRAQATSPYELEEADGLGVYLARYTLTSSTAADPLKFTKTKMRYLSPPATAGQAAQASFKIMKSEVVLQLHVNPFEPIALSATDEIGTWMGTKELARSSNHVELKLLETRLLESGPQAALAKSLATTLQRTPLQRVGALTPQEMEHAILTATLGKYSNDEVEKLLALIQHVDSKTSPKDWQSAMLKLNALIILHPERTKEVVSMLSKMEFSSRGAEVVVAALFNAPTREANEQTALLLDQRGGEPLVAARLLPVIQGNPFPSDAVQNSVERVMKILEQPDIKNMAWLTLGAMALQYRDKNPAKATQVIDSAQRELLKDNSDRSQILIALAVIGNGALPDTPQRVKDYLEDAQPAVRAEAVSSLRMVRGGESQALILKSMTEDAAPEVRGAAAQAMSVRPEPVSDNALDALADRLLSEKSLEVQYRIDSALVSIGTKQPSSLSRIKKALEACAVQAREYELRRSCEVHATGMRN
ncbi:MAG: HEAT repeat domain-containing protein [Methylotenera sp.]|nr:HEAT repeat domain-containing protein [Oligoflexia bacterium]